MMKIGSIGEKNKEFLEFLLKFCAKKKSEKIDYVEYGYPDIIRYMSFNLSTDYGYIFYENNSKNAILEEKN